MSSAGGENWQRRTRGRSGDKCRRSAQKTPRGPTVHLNHPKNVISGDPPIFLPCLAFSLHGLSRTLLRGQGPLAKNEISIPGFSLLESSGGRGKPRGWCPACHPGPAPSCRLWEPGSGTPTLGALASSSITRDSKAFSKGVCDNEIRQGSRAVSTVASTSYVFFHLPFSSFFL